MTQPLTAEAKAQLILEQAETDHACRMPQNFRAVAIRAILAALANLPTTASKPDGRRRPVLIANGKPIPEAARVACLELMGRDLFKFADLVRVLVDNGVGEDNSGAQKLAERLLQQYRRRGLVVSAGSHGYWQAAQAGDASDDEKTISLDHGNGSVEADLLRTALIEAASNFHLIALHGDMYSMHRDARAGRDRVLNALVTAA